MGRGRQKAKQTKVARQLKYFSPETNYKALEQELRGEVTTESRVGDSYSDEYEDHDPYMTWRDER
ncbi:DUF3073 domain-containing protein [Jonesia denitrificans]|jgi:hypothetical protein|uniref:DUF3073 domain-containing protein n=1 Tax=Jonesia denitrificans (strain ATCC 14870 / DSM 20603 / BCRC 15368 / CIP 55.134 / JCM 11481 / NBRC 15587 / NCTC 10816 / Prevot 55134) TaxID=471856 RepID=C7R2J3_JONDD|nr:DUF3073 domain-containing protein [Jonesia denitrificans]ACV09984.1 hypothetical protein Jden_2350 [Jonesia denitrificans DSM 20603]ASE08778.1 DUF3073 domain-containing protein [Jonesia denitrificans]QXB43384.1 DUF3073 domain-containing protein [Jonesia denitrificans]SQH22758.1 Protein of uncharacterised function (DUF3073) [Jonesia denitrificans]